MINREIFFNFIRAGLFKGKLNQKQVETVNAILDEWDKSGETDLRRLAYIFGTCYHESYNPKDPDNRMTPIKESGSQEYLQSKPYYPFIGYGLVQLTWLANFKRIGALIKQDLVGHPEKALEIPIAAEIAVKGMIKGWFTGVSLKKYFNDTTEDWINARKIINRLDKADVISDYAKIFYKALTA